MSEKPKDMRAYLNSVSARERKQKLDRLNEVYELMMQAKKRKEYHTLTEYWAEYENLKKYFRELADRKRI